MSVELWRPIPGYEGIYSVSDRGAIRREGKRRGATVGRLLLPKVSGKKKKYRHVDLSRDDVKTRFLIHRLVAHAFIGPPPVGAEVNHKNFDGADNRVENLEWVTRQENINHAIAAGKTGGRSLQGTENGRSVLSERDVVAIIRLKGLLGQRRIASRFGVSKTLVQRIHQRKLWAHINLEEWPVDLHVQESPQC